MKKLLLVVIAFITVSVASAQKKKDWTKVTGRAGDHIMMQLSYDMMMGVADSVKDRMKGIPRGFNAYVMLDKVFKGSPRFSVAFGVGFSSSSFYFKKLGIDLKSTNTTLPFINQDSLNHFKKNKLAISYLEIPIELRFSSDPENDTKSIKAAIGFKIGTMLNAHTKGKTLQDKNDKTIYNYTQKETSRRYFNSTRMAATARIGYGNFSIFGSYQINNLFKDGVAKDSKVLQVGLTLSGL
ncbi:MAG: outer membrane beta-barrel protein [Chitinophagaceae bacterium]|nr:outer membrane beta-barrel protein [Chitinophagaceae bacterium]